MSDNKEVEIPFEEKVKIFDILKFTPCTYELNVWGYGGDSRFLRATKEQFLYFRKNKIDLETYAYDWDESETKVPEEFQPFPPGQPYEGSEYECASGATMDSCSTIEITDPITNKVIFSSSLDTNELDEHGVETEEVGEFYPNYDCKDGEVVIYHANGEKGTFYGGGIYMNRPFDPKRLKITYVDIDGWCILSNISYDEQDVDNNDYSTSGKWSETSWHVVGGEDKLDVFDDSKYEVTDWFPVTEYKPKRKGVYQCKFGGTDAWPFEGKELIEWTGRKWKTLLPIDFWRGLTNVGYLEALKDRE